MGTSRPAALIVEDQPFLGLVASDILRESGFDTFHAYGAEDAAALLEKHPEIEVVVTGVELAGDVDGLELCHKVSRKRPNVQLVVTTTGTDPVPPNMPLGAQVLRKPYSSGDLRTLVAPRSLLEDA